MKTSLPTLALLADMSPDTFLACLEQTLRSPRARFLNNRLIRHIAAGTITRELYIQQLLETWHFVKHTPSYITSAASRLPDGYEVLKRRFVQHAREELGHDQWVLEDLASLGITAAEVRSSTPLPHTSGLVAYQFYTVERLNPVGLLGLEYALEGSTASSAGGLVARLQQVLSLPDESLQFFKRHVAVDVHHQAENVQTLSSLVRAPQDRLAVLRNARDSYELYAMMYDGICDHLGV